MATSIDFPNTPALNQEYTYENATWKWNGITWMTLSSITEQTDLSNSVTNELDNYTGTSKATQIITCSLAEYNAIGTKNVNTLYIII